MKNSHDIIKVSFCEKKNKEHKDNSDTNHCQNTRNYSKESEKGSGRTGNP